MRAPIVFLLVVTLLAGALIFVVTRPGPPLRFAVGALASGPGEALVLTVAEGPDRRTRFWLEQIDGDSPLRWSAALAVAEERGTSLRTVAVADTQVIALGSGPDGLVAQAFDRTTGAVQWTRPLPDTDIKGATLGARVVIAGPSALFVHGLARSTARVDALALADGAALWTHDTSVGAELWPLTPARLLVIESRDATVFDPGTGAVVEKIPGVRGACPLGDAVMLTGDRVLVMSPTGTRVVPEEAKSFTVPSLCGTRDGDLVVSMKHVAQDLPGSIVRRTAGSDALRWQTTLGPRTVDRPAVVDGRLPRFLPFTMFGVETAKLVRELAIVDLDSGDVVWRRPTEDRPVVVLAPERAWIWFEHRGTLVGIDPATGELASATGFGDSISADPEHADVRFGQLWLTGREIARPDELPWAAVDLSSGEVVRRNGKLRVSDTTVEFRAMFRDE